MEKIPPKVETPSFERLELEPEGIGSLEFMGMKVRYVLDDPEEPNGTGPSKPAFFMFTQDYGYGATTEDTLSVWIWEGVPKKFKEILLYHELMEGYYSQLGVEHPRSHELAKKSHLAYAKQFLSAEDLNEFLEWQSQLPEGGTF